MVEIQKIEKNLWYVCTRNEYTGDYPDGDLTFKEGFAYKGEDILKEYSEDEIQKYYLRSFRLWTVQDAKPGDFLTYSSEDNKDWYLIYHSEYVPYENHYHYYACYTDKFYTGGTACIDADYLHPSTSKERNILLQKIEEAGYCWDAENQKLTKTAEELTHSATKISDKEEPANDYVLGVKTFKPMQTMKKGRLTLGDAIDAPELFATYPALRDAVIRFETFDGNDVIEETNLTLQKIIENYNLEIEKIEEWSLATYREMLKILLKKYGINDEPLTDDNIGRVVNILKFRARNEDNYVSLVRLIECFDELLKILLL